MADTWRRLRPKHPYVTAGLAVGIIVGVVVLVSLLHGRGAEPAGDSVPGAEPAGDSVPGAEPAGDSVPCSAEPAELSFITSFGKSNVHACYGSLVAPQYVVTTAYCITTNTAFLNLTMGSDLDGEGGVTRSISDYRFHPKWDPNDPKTWAYDQAVVKLDRPVDNIKPACLAAEGSVFPTGTNATVYCWCKEGTSEDLPANRTLQAVNVTVNDHGQCKQKYDGNMTDDMICAGNDAGGQNICQGDSGAPLVVKDGDDLILLGSNIRGPNSPAVYLIHDNTFTTDAITQMSDPPQVTQCGMRNNVPDVRVENGQVSAPHSLPWMAYLESDNGFFWGGATLIHESFVLTERVPRHPNSKYPYLGMQLVKLSRPVKFTKNIGPICLPKPGHALPAGSDCLISGWGDRKKPWGNDVLREGSVTTITTDQCRREYADWSDKDECITNATICIAFEDNKSYPSYLDQGGPLMCEEKDSLIYNLQGVHFWPLPFLYHNVSMHVPWINEILSQFPADASSRVCFKKFEG